VTVRQELEQIGLLTNIFFAEKNAATVFAGKNAA
jgi:hypothetical protein